MKHHSRKPEKYAVKTRDFPCQNNSPETNPASSTISKGSFSELKSPELDAENTPSFSARWRMAGTMPPPVLVGGRNSLDNITSCHGLAGPGLETR